MCQRSAAFHQSHKAHIWCTLKPSYTRICIYVTALSQETQGCFITQIVYLNFTLKLVSFFFPGSKLLQHSSLCWSYFQATCPPGTAALCFCSQTVGKHYRTGTAGTAQRHGSPRSTVFCIAEQQHACLFHSYQQLQRAVRAFGIGRHCTQCMGVRDTWTLSYTTYCREPALAGGWTHDPQSCPPTPTIL